MVKPPPFPAESGLPEPPGRLYPVRSASAPPTGPAPAVDPVLVGFDRMVALGGYGLLFVSPFTFGVPALAALVLSLVHRQASNPLVRSHYRFQTRIFLIALALALLAVLSALIASGLFLEGMVALFERYAGSVAASIGPSTNARQPLVAGGFVAASFVILGLSALWTLGLSAYGFLRLIANRPIGHGETRA